MRSILFYFILLFYPISTSLGKESELFWKVKTNLILTTDARFEGAQLCTSLEDELMENAEGSDIKYEENNALDYNLNSNNMIELVVTNSKEEEVTLFVTDAVYNLIYKKKDLRKNPSIFHRPKFSESTDEYQNNNVSQEVEPTGRIVYIKKYYSPDGANKHLPVIQKFNYSNIQFSINSSSVSVSAMNTFNFTNGSGNE
ncbi:hypothetical protein [Cryptosporidium parvum Iowa II]|uniref:Uncharacterized protein n=2 Tax=Cryptosporidium parvum TaxID=5807 RepID=Q5CYI6_CRYPI|nr:hypothetical protein [Cryptosporidium parvum Iowa II]EAK90248.1 hypothetical protein, signal peptide [Cryptosporidium parvum Iowa II]QOY40538.1 Uncharacterized protein CPATCC_0008000 [Cryptosporidium parvum]WKS78908.1 putative signal peptide-containing protein [Cryptosporidium sp. 43IA8]WRK33392.1 Uncharacterized protein cpbgf_7002210 [Cryptosporidium parvum]|eukprot:QOY40538.1 hypothetical protein CPATCC_003401 [Cryptosporidium parvum]